MDESEKQVRDELNAIADVLEDILGRQSRWNGEVELSDEAAAYGKALWNGGIVLNRGVAASDARWRTEIHELLHTFSPGLTASDYLLLPGWEEGVVEQLQRSLRPHILARLSVHAPASVFAIVETGHQYNRYIAALDGLVTTLDDLSGTFYRELLAVPLKDRPAAVVQRGRQLPADNFRGFQREFALAFSILRGD